MARISKQERMEQIREQVMDITMRIEYLAEREPEVLNYIQRTVEGLCAIDNDTIKIENSIKILTMRTVGRMKTENCIRGIFGIAQAMEQKEKNK